MSCDPVAASSAITSPTFYTVTNSRYFPGTIATLSSIRRFYPSEPIYVFPESRWSLTAVQIEHLRRLEGVCLIMPGDFPFGAIREAYQMKAHGACYLGRNGHRCVIQVDSDAVLCSRLDAVAEEVITCGLPAGGKDLEERYDLTKYAPYFELCQTTPEALRPTASPYISTSIFFLPAVQMQGILELWSLAVDDAVQFGPQNRPRKIYPGYSDQGVFNAILYFKGITPIVLDNLLVSQHWKHGREKIDLKDGVFWNGDQRQLAFHSVGDAPKFWTSQYVGFVAKSGKLDDVYRYWLSNLFDGACGLLRSESLTSLEEKQKDYFPGGLPHLFREYQERVKPLQLT